MFDIDIRSTMPTGRVLESAFEYHSMSRTSRTAHSLPRKSHFEHYSASESPSRVIRPRGSSSKHRAKNILISRYRTRSLSTTQDLRTDHLEASFLEFLGSRDRDETTSRDDVPTVGRCTRRVAYEPDARRADDDEEERKREER